MCLFSQSISKLILNYGINLRDTGSASVQIAILTNKIKCLQNHLNIHKKDHHSRRGLLFIVSLRKRLLNYLKNKNNEYYKSLIKDLGLRH